MADRLRVMLTTEGTYPFHQGGVSTWCHMFVDKLQVVDYVVYSIIMNPYVTQKFELRPETTLIKVPLWGTEEPNEHLDRPFSQVYLAKRRTDQRVIREHFIPLFINLMSEIISVDKSPVRLGRVLSEMHTYFHDYDYKTSFTSDLTWSAFKSLVFEAGLARSKPLAEPSVFDLTQSLGWIYRFLTVLNTPLPQVDVSHSAAAAFCGIPCVVAKIQNKTPFLLTEHGVYLREQYLALQRRGQSPYMDTFLIRLIQSISSLNYAFADQVSPVCQYNTRWERAFGVRPETIEVIYNGVDERLFSPGDTLKTQPQPTVVSVARIDPVKDVISLIRAAGIVRTQIPGVKFLIYGSVSVPSYFEECKALVAQLELEQSFIFAGHTNDVPAAYRSGDLVVLSSITEGFPYSVVEAMMVGKPVVATDVGGVREAIGECGIVVRPREPEELAQALVRLLQDQTLRAAMGNEARQRALSYFTVERSLRLYLESYRRLVDRRERSADEDQHPKCQLSAQRGYASMESGNYHEAIAHYRLAVAYSPRSASAPVWLAEIAEAYNRLGMFDQAFFELDKAQVLAQMLEDESA